MKEYQESDLVIEGGDAWTAEELAELVRNLYILYNRTSVLHSKRYRSAKGLANQLSASKSRVNPKKKLTVDSMEIASPMRLDLRGSGEIVKEIREFTKDLGGRNRIERERLRQELANETMQNQLDQAERKLDLIQKTADILKSLDASPEERARILGSILHPALEAINIIEEKNLTVIDSESNETSED